MKQFAVLILALSVPLLANAELDPEVKKYIEEYVDEYADTTIQLALPSSVYDFDVTDSGFRVFSDGYTTVSVSLYGIKSYSSESEIVLQVINWMGLPLTNVKFSVGVYKKGVDHFSEKRVSIPLMDPGKENLLTVRFQEKLESFDTIRVDYLGPNGLTFEPANRR